MTSFTTGGSAATFTTSGTAASFTTGGSVAVFSTVGTAATFAVTYSPATFTTPAAIEFDVTSTAASFAVTGAAGTDGADGVGVPAGGTASQVLAKIDSTNYNTQWVTPSAGGGASLPSQTGNAGEFLTTDGATASWGTALIPVNTGVDVYLESANGLAYLAVDTNGVESNSENVDGQFSVAFANGGTASFYGTNQTFLGYTAAPGTVTFSGSVFRANGTVTQFVPSQATHSGKYLTTDGSNLSWGTVTGGGGAHASTHGAGGADPITTLGTVTITNGTVTTASFGTVAASIAMAAQNISRTTADGGIRIWGGTVNNLGGNITVWSSGAANANQINLDGSLVNFRSEAGVLRGYVDGTGIVSFAADTATAATHYWVQTGSDDYIRPKLLADVKTEVVTSAAVVAAVGTAIPVSLADAKGDLIVATGADAFARLAVGGTAGHVLTVDSAETTGLKWAAASGGTAVAATVIEPILLMGA